MNAMNTALGEDLLACFDALARDADARAVVFTGAGDRAFCAGGDVKQQGEEHMGDPANFDKWMKSLVGAHEALRRLGKPSIARINGIVAGGGNEWNLACDLAIAADHSRFIQVETKVGISGSVASARLLPLFVGERRAKEMMLLGEPVSANKALLWGLVNDVVPYGELDAAVDRLCQKLIDRFPRSLKFAQQQIGFWKNLAWESSLRCSREHPSSQLPSDEAKEGLRALAERREVDYRAFREKAARQDLDLMDAFENGPNDSGSQVTGGPTRSCPDCGAADLPGSFGFCGRCGARLP